MRINRLISAMGAAGAVGLGLSWGVTPTRAASPDDFTGFSYDWSANNAVDPGWDVPGQLYVPTDYDPSKSYGLVTFLHGIGERGHDNTSQINRNIDALLEQAKSRDFFLYAPQSQRGWWAEFPHVVQMVGKAATQYSIDPSRLYLTGLSAGGAGVQSAIGQYNDVFAAFVPLSAAGVVSGSNASEAVGTPIWYYHARNDNVVDVYKSRQSVNNIRNADGLPDMTFPLNNSTGNPNYNDGSPYYTDGSTFYAHHNLRYSEYATGGHSNAVWARAYRESPLYEWMLDKTRSMETLETGRSILVDVYGSRANEHEVDSLGRHWNGAGGHKANLTEEVVTPFARDARGRRTTITVSVSGAFRHDIDGGIFDNPNDDAPSGITALDDFAGGDYWLVGNADNDPQTPGELTFTGLTPGGEYALKLFASISGTDGGRGYYGVYQAQGQSVLFDASDNLSDFIDLTGLLADADGTLTLRVTPDNGSRYAVLNALQLTAIPEPASLALVGWAACVLLTRRAARDHAAGTASSR